MSPTKIAIRAGHVGLVLLDGALPFYLEIPVGTINANSLDAARYLLFVGWCVLGVEGTLSLESGGEELDPGTAIKRRGIYYYVRDDDELCAVDLEVIKTRTTTPSETTATREEFRDRLLQRDIFCVWTGLPEKYGNALHIIPFRRGSEWLELIVQHRPHYDEDVNNLNNINDIRNGVFANSIVHSGFDSREAVILKTPNRYLDIDDIPTNSRDPHDRVSCPQSERYTLQWLILHEAVQTVIPNNRDAAFKKHTKQPKPSALLLYYNYGAAAVKLWGCNIGVLQGQFKPPRPVPAASGPKTTVGDRTVTTRKLEKARAEAEAERDSAGGRRAGPSGTVRATRVIHGAAPVIHKVSPAETGCGEEGSGKQTTWDEDDVVLFFWGNSRAAKDRHSKKTQENVQRMDRWTKGLSYV